MAMAPSNGKSWLKNFIFSCIVVVLFFIITELLLSVYDQNYLGLQAKQIKFAIDKDHPIFPEIFIDDPRAGYRLKPYARYKTSNFNSLGFNDDELNPRATYKILCLGDSVTFGWELASNHSTFCSQLEGKLNSYFQKINLSLTVDTFNAGIPTHSIYQGLQVYLNNLQHLGKWDIIIASFGWNEEWLFKYAQFILRNPPMLKNIKSQSTLLGKLKIYKFLSHNYSKLFGDKSKNWDEVLYLYKKYYGQLVQAGIQNGSKFIIIPLLLKPSSFEKGYIKRKGMLNAWAKEIALQYDQTYLQTDSIPVEQVDWIDPIHFGEKGNQWIAELLFQKIKAMLI